MNLNKYIITGLSLSFILSIVGCGSSSSSNEDISNTEPTQKIEYDKRTVELINVDPPIDLNNHDIDLYFKKDSEIPYIGIKELFNSLEGLYKKDVLKIEFNKDSALITNTLKNTTMLIDDNDDTITTSSSNFFDFVEEYESDLYKEHYVQTEKINLNGFDFKTTYKLKNYNFNVDFIDNDVILPLNILNKIAFDANHFQLLYNFDKVYYFYGFIDDSSEYYEAFNKDLTSKTISDELIDARFNELCFIIDYFYGLRKTKNILSFKEYIKSKPKIYQKLMSNNVDIFNEGFLELLNKEFNDPHTCGLYSGFFKEYENHEDINLVNYFPNDYSDRSINMFNIQEYLLKQYYDIYHNDGKFVRTYDNLGFIRFNKFMFDYKENIYNEDGSIKEDAFIKDTFYLVKQGLDELSKNKNIKNVVIDLSCNLGGAVSTAISILGLLTNKDIVIPFEDLYNNEDYLLKYKVDSDDDGDYNDNDAYDQFNYYILTSEASFSSSLLLSGVAKDMGIAALIGKKSCGGKCEVSSSCLIDGTAFNHSGNKIIPGIRYNKDGLYNFYEIENGLDVDIDIPIDKFYDLEYLSKIINDRK